MADVSSLTPDQILRIPQDAPERLFPGTLDAAKSQYRKLAAKWHPDRGGDTKVFAHVQVLYAAAEKRILDGTWRAFGVLRFKDIKGHDHTVAYKKARAFELGWLYYNENHATFSVELQYEDLFRNALSAVQKDLRYADAAMQKEHSRYMPNVISAVHGVDRFVVQMHKQADQYLLRDVLELHGGKLPPEHVAWIISSLLNVNCYLNYTGVVHNAIGPDTWFVSPENHSGALLGGWWYAVRNAQRLHAVPNRAIDYGPADLLIEKRATRRTDSALIRATGRELLGDISGSKLAMGKNAPQPMLTWLMGVGQKDAYGEYHMWYHKVLQDAFGPRRFVRMTVNPSDIYTEGA